MCNGEMDCPGGRDEFDVNTTPLSLATILQSGITFQIRLACSGPILLSVLYIISIRGDSAALPCKYNVYSPQCDRNRPLCKAKEFQCPNGWCLQPEWVCDGFEDCLGGEDEAKCAKCHDALFQCRPEQCIVKSLVCDGEKNCDNGRDEMVNLLVIILVTAFVNRIIIVCSLLFCINTSS